MKKIEGQTVVHRREKMSLPKFDRIVLRVAGDSGSAGWAGAAEKILEEILTLVEVPL